MNKPIKPPEEGNEPPVQDPPATPPTPPTPPVEPPATPPATPPPAAPDYQEELKKKDAQIQDLQNTVATIEERTRALTAKGDNKGASDINDRVEKIMENSVVDPKAAAAEMTKLLNEMQTGAVTQAQSVIAGQTIVEKLKNGVRQAHPNFDDATVEYVMQQADAYAKTGKYKTAKEAVDAAANYTKSVFDNYAKKANVAPPLPPGAGAKTGPNTPPAPAPAAPVLPTPGEEIAERQTAQQRKII